MFKLSFQKIAFTLTLVAVLLVLWLCAAFYLVAAKGDSIYNPAPSKNLSYKVKTSTELRSNKYDEKIEIRTAQSQKPSSEIFLYLHGNAGPVPRIVEGLSQFGTVISPAYPGFAGSTGLPSPDRLYNTVDVAMSYLQESGLEQSQITVVGHSMGASTALYAGKNYPKLKKLILLNAYFSIQAMCQRQYYILCILSGDILNNSKLAPEMMVKVRQFHDPKDQTVPYEQGRELFDIIGSDDKKFTDLQITVDGDAHSGFNIAEILQD